MDEVNQNEGDLAANAIWSPPPSFPNKQSTLKNQNMIKVSMANDLENIDMWDIEGDIKEGEESKDDNTNVRNIFGSIVDFITNKNGLEEESKSERERDLRSKLSPDAKNSLGKLEIKKGALKAKKAVKEDSLPLKSSNSGNDLTSKVMGLFSRNTQGEEELKETQTAPVKKRKPLPVVNKSKDEKLYEIGDEERENWVKMLNYYR